MNTRKKSRLKKAPKKKWEIERDDILPGEA